MTPVELFDLVEAHQDLEGAGVVVGQGHDDAVYVMHRPSQIVTRVPARCLPHVDANQLLPVLLMEREPKVLIHMSRVVGYFSRIEGWNRSKIGELRDRINGNYSFDGGVREGGRQTRTRAAEALYS